MTSRGAPVASGTPFRLQINWKPAPGVVVALAPRPRATVCNPYRDRESLLEYFPILYPKEENRTADGRGLTRIIKELYRLAVPPQGGALILDELLIINVHLRFICGSFLFLG